MLPGSAGAARRGLLWILDEEVLIPGSGDGTAFERLCSYFATRGPDQEGELGSAPLPSLGITHCLWEFGKCGRLNPSPGFPPGWPWGAVPATGDGHLRRCEQTLHFEICHQLGTAPVRYDLTGWVSKAKFNLSAQNAIQVLQN